MLKGDLMQMLITNAKAYRPLAGESVVRNSHMNELSKDEVIPQRHIDAILVDFINYVGFRQGMDLGLYTENLGSE